MQKQLIDFGVKAPSGRDSSAVYSQVFTLSRTVSITPGMYAAGWLLDLYATPTGSGTGTALMAEAVTRVEIKDENGEIVFKNQGRAALGLASIASHFFAGEKGALCMKDAALTTSTSSYRAWWKFIQNMKGEEFTIEVDINPALLAGFTLTALALSLGFDVLESDEQGEQVDLVGQVQTTATKFESKDAYGIMLYLDAEFGATLTELTVNGRDLNTGQIVRIENETALALTGLYTAGAEDTVQFIPGIYGPISAAQGYYLAVVGEDYLNIKGSLSSSTLCIVKAIPTATKFESKDAYGIMLYLDAEFGATLTELTVNGRDLNTGQIVRIENETALALTGLYTAGAEDTVQFIPGIYGPISAAQGYYLAVVGEDYLNIKGSLSSSTLCIVKAIPAKLDVAEVN